MEKSVKYPLLEISGEAVEVVLDSFHTDGIAKELPIIGLLIKGYKTIETISDRILYKKIIKFLTPLAESSKTERINFRQRMQMDKAFQNEVQEQLLLYIEKVNHFEKAELMGLIFRDGYLKKKISYSDFNFLSSIIVNSHLEDLNFFFSNYENLFQMSDEIKQRLYKNDILDTRIELTGDLDVGKDPYGEGVISYEISRLGNLLLEIINPSD